MPKFVMTYAYDVPCYVDFIVEAESEEAAEALAQAALDAGRFSDVSCEPDWDMSFDERCFACEEATESDLQRNSTMEIATAPRPEPQKVPVLGTVSDATPKPRVVIEVLGGVAQCTHDGGCEVEIIDHDNNAHA